MLFLLIGCITPFKKVSADFQNPAEYDILLVTAMVDTQRVISTTPITKPSIGEAVVAGIIEGVEAARLYPILDEFSADSTAQLQNIWMQEGFQVRTDSELVQRDISEKRREFHREIKHIEGLWYHPEGSGYLRIDNYSLSSQKVRARWISDFNHPKEKEAFLFSTITVQEVQTGLFSKAPMIIVDTVVVGEEGEYLYQARGIGYGYPSRFAIDYRRESLDYGFREALDSLTEVEIEIIKPKKK